MLASINSSGRIAADSRNHRIVFCISLVSKMIDAGRLLETTTHLKENEQAEQNAEKPEITTIRNQKKVVPSLNRWMMLKSCTSAKKLRFVTPFFKRLPRRCSLLLFLNFYFAVLMHREQDTNYVLCCNSCFSCGNQLSHYETGRLNSLI